MFFQSSCHKKKQRRSREAEQKNGHLRRLVTKKRNKARGQRRRHRLAIDRYMDRSAAKKKRKKAACDRLFVFSIVLPQQKTEKEPRGRTKEWPLARVGHQKKEQGERPEATACDRSVYGSISRKKKKRTKAACNRLIVFSIVLPQKKTEKEPIGRTKEWPLATVGLQKKGTLKRSIEGRDRLKAAVD